VVQAKTQPAEHEREFTPYRTQHLANVFLTANVQTFSPKRRHATSGVPSPLALRSSRRERRNQFSIPTRPQPAHW